MESRGVGVLLLLLIGAAVVHAVGTENVRIWPMPATVSYGGRKLYLSNDFQLSTEATKYQDRSGILKEAFDRMLSVARMNHEVASNFSGDQKASLLRGMHVVIAFPSDELNYGVDESYKLLVPSVDKPSFARLEARTVYGALNGLQTFSQLCHFNFGNRVLEIKMAPWSIVDEPRFAHRGLLIDTARHYLPLPVIRNVIDSMAYAKLVPSYPKLLKGAYSAYERYTVDDAAEIVQYAQRRGIHVLPEIDVPGHAASWGKGYHFLWPSKDCQEPLDVSNELTFKVIDGILSDFSKIFKYKFVHLGGDEVNTSCWTVTPRISDWLRKQGLNESLAYQYFVLRAQKIALSHGYEIINWEETFNKFGDKLSKKIVVHNWLGAGVAEQVTAAGLRCIVSNQDKWYLDHIDTPWQEFYMNEPLIGIVEEKQQNLVIGGELCMWGEHIDGSDIEQTIWPRAAAAAERLWTPYDKLAKDPEKVIGRLAHFRCLLNQRGVAAGPLFGLGRSIPVEPGSCYTQ